MRNLGVVTGTLIPIILWGVLLLGWVKCLIKLTECDWEPSYKAEVIYTAGVLTGLGGIIGYLDVEDAPQRDTNVPHKQEIKN